jgi:RNA polymerase sigma factor (sigma-70 family)
LRLDDEMLISRCLEGDQAAFTFLVNRYKEMVHAYAYYKVGDYQEAQDIAQEVFIKAYRKLGQLKWPHKFQSWLYTIVSNECKMWLRQHSKEREQKVYLADTSASELTELAMRSHNDKEMKFTVKNAIKSLPNNSRLVLSLYYMSDLPIKAIASFMGISPNNAKVKLHRARKQLGERLQKMLKTQLEQEKLKSGFIFTVMNSIKNLPLPSVPKPPPVKLTPISIAAALLIGVIGFGFSFGRGDLSSMPRQKSAAQQFDVRLLSNFEAREVSGMKGANGNKDFTLQNTAFKPANAKASKEKTGKTDAVHQIMSPSENRSTKSEEQQMITIDLSRLPEDAQKLEMVLIKPGTFTMGSPREERGRSEDEWPPHKVTITKPFYMGKYEVTQAHWEAVMGSKSHRSKFRGRPNNPVEKVSWRACQKFIKRLNHLGEGTFRLPTEAEWEYACRAWTGTRFSFGDTLEDAGKYMWWSGNNTPDETKEVGLKSPNPWGLCDMHGNVLEWCSDRWEKPYARGPQIDPQGLAPGFFLFSFWTSHVYRGGSYRNDAQSCRSDYRSYEQSFDYHYSLGFRLVREYP